MIRTLLIFLFYGVLLALFATLVAGIFNVFCKAPQRSQKSNRLMRLRVLLQGTALVVLALLLYSS